METKELTFIILHQYYKVYQTIYQNKDTLKKNKVLVDCFKGLIGIGNNTKYEDSKRIKNDIKNEVVIKSYKVF